MIMEVSSDFLLKSRICHAIKICYDLFRLLLNLAVLCYQNRSLLAPKIWFFGNCHSHMCLWILPNKIACSCCLCTCATKRFFKSCSP
jgi:hypothetical protein